MCKREFVGDKNIPWIPGAIVTHFQLTLALPKKNFPILINSLQQQNVAVSLHSVVHETLTRNKQVGPWVVLTAELETKQHKMKNITACITAGIAEEHTNINLPLNQ